jgi:hypothetical protein
MSTPAAPLRPPRTGQPSRRRAEKRIITGALALVITVVAAISACTSSAGTSGSTGTGTPGTGVNSPTSSPASSAAPKTSSAPEAPTTSAFDEKYGSFPTFSKSAGGDGVVNLPAKAKAGLVIAKAAGTGNFVIEALNAKNKETGLLVNVIGAYRGTTAFGLQDEDVTRLKITATARWTVQVAPISTARQLRAGVTSRTDAVYLWLGGASDWAMTHKGDSNFVVTEYGDEGPNLLVNEIGKYNGTVPAGEGPAVVTVEASSLWTLRIS